MADGKEVRGVVEDQLPGGSHTNGGGDAINDETIMDEVDFGESVLRLDRCSRLGCVLLVTSPHAWKAGFLLLTEERFLLPWELPAEFSLERV